jgi:hypothetical protein
VLEISESGPEFFSVASLIGSRHCAERNVKPDTRDWGGRLAARVPFVSAILWEFFPTDGEGDYSTDDGAICVYITSQGLPAHHW